MVLILTEQNDTSSNHVIDWLTFFYKKHCLRINTNTSEIPKINIEIIEINTQRIILTINNNRINVRNINSVWFRRGFFDFELLDESTSSHLKILKSHLMHEKDTLRSFLNFILLGKNTIGDFYNQNINKLYVLTIAQSLKINIPNTAVITTKEALVKFQDKNKKVITKSISGSLIVNDENFNIICYTSLVEKSHLESIAPAFYPSLLQQYIEKKYEIRTFYIRGIFFSMAIFSQTDEKTKIDFRNYNTTKPNRRVPYLLPKYIERKLHLLMVKMGLNTGSIDIIVDKNNKYYFLEVNPVGQFGMVSIPCNYHLEKRIAEILSK